MNRRQFIGLVAGAAVWPFAVRAQQRERVSRVARVGILNYGAAGYVRVNEFRNALGELGYVEGRNLMLTHRWADGRGYGSARGAATARQIASIFYSWMALLRR